MSCFLRGLDVSPKRISQLQSAKDKKSADLLEQIERDEVTHVTSGVTWYKYLCQRLHLVLPLLFASRAYMREGLSTLSVLSSEHLLHLMVLTVVLRVLGPNPKFPPTGQEALRWFFEATFRNGGEEHCRLHGRVVPPTYE